MSVSGVEFVESFGRVQQNSIHHQSRTLLYIASKYAASCIFYVSTENVDVDKEGQRERRRKNMITCDSQKHLVALAATKLGDIMQEQDDSMKNDVAADQKGLNYYWNLTTVYPKKMKRSASTSWKSYSFKRLKSDGSSSSSSSTAETEQTNNSRDDMEIHRGCYT